MHKFSAVKVCHNDYRIAISVAVSILITMVSATRMIPKSMPNFDKSEFPFVLAEAVLCFLTLRAAFLDYHV